MVCPRTARVAVHTFVPRTLGGLAVVVSLFAFAPEVEANGRPPATSTINFKRGDDAQIVAGMSFGVLASSDGGATWRWMCEGAVGYGGMYDPDYAFATTGSLFATTFDGMKIRRDACVFGASSAGMKFVSKLTIGPDGAVYFAASDPMDAKVYKSTDDGVTFPVSATPGQISDWYQSLEVAPSDPARLYLTGYRFVANPDGDAGNVKVFFVARSTDGGMSWNNLPITDFATMSNSTIDIVGISKTNPDLVFARVTLEDNAIASAIYRSTNGGQNWTRVLGKQGEISLLVRANGDLIAGTLNQGSVKSIDNGASWQDLAGAPHINCLAENNAATEVWACTQNYGGMQAPSDNAGIMKTSDLVTWTKVLRYQEIQAPVDCPVGTAQRDMCDTLWCGLCAQLGCDPKRECPGLGVDAPPDGPSDKPASKSGCCETGGGSASSGVIALLVGLIVLRRRRSVRMRRGAALALLALAVAWPTGDARANGRPPVTNGVFFKPADNQTIFVRSTFGLLVSRDDGCSFRWICEQNIGYGGTFDPKYAVATDGTIFATTFLGLRVSRDGGCSFTTATSELPAGDPGRIADVWVDALDIAANGDIWVATAESGKPNNIYRSTDNGVTFAPRGMVSPTIWWKSVKVAPSDPMRVYISGYEVASPTSDAMGSPSAHLLFSNDTGQSWTPVTLSGVQFGITPIVMVVAVDPADPLRIYVISVESNGSRGDRLYRSIDGGMTLTEVLATTEPITDLVIRDATTVLAASAAGGTFRSDDGGQTFVPLAGAPRLGCLGKRPDGTLIGCGANWDPDFMAVGESSDSAQWQKIFRFVELAGAVACPAGTPGFDVCDQQLWPGMQQQFGATGPKDPACAVTSPVDMPSDPGKSGGCCDAGSGAPLGALLLAALVALFGFRKRSCCGSRERRTS